MKEFNDNVITINLTYQPALVSQYDHKNHTICYARMKRNSSTNDTNICLQMENY